MYTYLTRINFYDADGAGVLFFGNIFRIIHSAYEDFINKGNFKRNYFSDDKYIVPIIHTGADYIKPIFPNSNIKVELSIQEVKNSSFVLLYEIYDEKEELLARCTTVHVFVEKMKWNKTDIPAEVKKYLKEHLIEK
jgi:YbgC/YbaW family acyl-CoA thioester hydrolase